MFKVLLFDLVCRCRSYEDEGDEVLGDVLGDVFCDFESPLPPPLPAEPGVLLSIALRNGPVLRE